MSTPKASHIAIFILGVACFLGSLCIQKCSRDPIPETLFPDVTETPDLTSNPGRAVSPQTAQTSSDTP